MSSVKNQDVGQANSRKLRSEAGREFAQRTFVRIMVICSFENARTLQSIANQLNEFGFRTIRGERWTPGNVHRILKRKGVTAKELHKRVHVPSPYQQTAAETHFRRWPVETYRAHDQAVRRLIEENGEWVSALLYAPRKAPGRTRIRHPVYGEGQVWRVISPSKYLCSFIDWAEKGTGSYEVECVAAEIDVWRYRLSAEERDALRERLKAWYFR